MQVHTCEGCNQTYNRADHFITHEAKCQGKTTRRSRKELKVLDFTGISDEFEVNEGNFESFVGMKCCTSRIENCIRTTSIQILITLYHMGHFYH